MRFNNLTSSFQDYKEMWKFARTAYEAMDGFYNGSLLDKYPRETDDKYEARQKIAYYTNLFAPAVNRYVGYLYKQRPTRVALSRPDIVDIISNDIDLKGNNIDVFMGTVAKNLKIRGVAVVLVDNFKELGTNAKEQMSERKYPYFVEIYPENIDSFVLDIDGTFKEVSILDVEWVQEDGEWIEKEVKYTYTKNEWVKELDGEIVEQGEHNLGVNPVQYISENGKFPTIGEFTTIASLNKRHYNLTSELDEQLRGNTFSILTLNANDPKKDVDLKLSTENALTYGRDLERPAFIAPDIAPAQMYQDRIEKMEKTIREISYDITTNKAHESGIALSIKFDGLNSSLANFASRLNNFERNLFNIVARYLGIDNLIEITYPKDFNITDVEKEVAILSDVKDLGYVLPEYEKQKLMQIITNDLHNVSYGRIEDIKKEVEEYIEGVKLTEGLDGDPNNDPDNDYQKEG